MVSQTLIEELKQQKIWLIYFKTITKNGNTTKSPRSAKNTATGADKAHADTLVTYDEAASAMKLYEADGVGLVIPEDYFLLDIDHRELSDPFVQMMLARFDTYTEYSPSGNGIHILGKLDKDRLPIYYDEKNARYRLDSAYYYKNSKLNLEIYPGCATARFSTFTGNVIKDLPLKDCTQALLTTFDKEMRKKEKVRYSSERDGDKASFDIICDLRKQKNADKFIKLYDKGDFSDYGSQSEADAALCSMIAFRTGDDPEMVDEIFRTSALMRDKWERDDYRENTIRYAIDSLEGQFHKSVRSRPPFIVYDEAKGREYVIPNLLAQYVREHLNYVLVRDDGRHALMKYVYEDGYYQYHADDMMKGRIKQFIADYDETLVNLRDVNAALEHIKTDLDYVPMDLMDADESIINFQNGLLRITADDMELIPHSPDIYSTIQIPCEWSFDNTATPVFDAYMHTLTDGNKDIEKLLLQFIGVCISNVKGYRLKKSLFLVGDGDTGKSQLKSLVEKLLGKGNFIGIDLKEIESRFGTGSTYGKRLAGSSDMSFLSVDELKTFKKMTGGDSVFAEMKGEQGFEYTYGGMLWFCMNRLPKFGGDNGQWVYDRIMVVNCPNIIPKAKQDKELLDKMYAERSGIIHKAVLALQEVIANGYRFNEPDCIFKARADYQQTNSTVITFYNECMCPWENGKINRHYTAGRIFKVYQAWCKDNNNGFAQNAKEFREQLADYLGTTFSEMTTMQKGNRYYRNLTITGETKELYAKEYGYDDETDFLQ